MERISASEVGLFELPRFNDERGNLSFLEEGNLIPFPIQRIYWIYDVPGGQYRGGHAYKQLKEVIIALSGSFDVIVNDGETEEKYQLNRSYKALFIDKLVWRKLENFSTNALCLIIASEEYNEKDYIRSFDEFLKLKQ